MLEPNFTSITKVLTTEQRLCNSTQLSFNIRTEKKSEIRTQSVLRCHRLLTGRQSSSRARCRPTFRRRGPSGCRRGLKSPFRNLGKTNTGAMLLLSLLYKLLFHFLLVRGGRGDIGGHGAKGPFTPRPCAYALKSQVLSHLAMS